MIPNDIKFSLHVLLVEHGKCCKRCAKNGQPRRTPIGECPLFGRGRGRAAEAAAAAGGARECKKEDHYGSAKKVTTAAKAKKAKKVDGVKMEASVPTTTVKVKVEAAATVKEEAGEGGGSSLAPARSPTTTGRRASGKRVRVKQEEPCA
jgi:hypothetical protein